MLPMPRNTAIWLQGACAEQKLGQGERLSTAVAKYYFKLMAYKDEYEVAPVHQWRFPTN
jgi:indolepyruvate ferredoxin oxidoreductase